MGQVKNELMSAFGNVAKGISKGLEEPKSTLPKLDQKRVAKKTNELMIHRMKVQNRYNKGNLIKPVEPIPVHKEVA